MILHYFGKKTEDEIVNRVESGFLLSNDTLYNNPIEKNALIMGENLSVLKSLVFDH